MTDINVAQGTDHIVVIPVEDADTDNEWLELVDTDPFLKITKDANGENEIRKLTVGDGLSIETVENVNADDDLKDLKDLDNDVEVVLADLSKDITDELPRGRHYWWLIIENQQGEFSQVVPEVGKLATFRVVASPA